MAERAVWRRQIETRSKKVRGRSARSRELIDAMRAIAEEAQPITGRGIGYKLFTMGLIDSMRDMQQVYRLLRVAREEGAIPWSWVVDETRSLERVSTWDDPSQYARCVARSYRRDFWAQQPTRCEVWSEKGTVRGVLQPILDELAVGFRVLHGFGSATSIHDAAEDFDGRSLTIFYVGDYDPSGLYMSEADLPSRLERYGGDHVRVERVALTREQVRDLPSFPASDKRGDPRFPWFSTRHGDRCWELDALDPRELRAAVEAAIRWLIEPEAWERCERINRAEQESLREVLAGWKAARGRGGFQ